MSRAREAALKALSLDEGLAEAHTALGFILILNDYDFAGAEREYKRAIELNPNDARAHQLYGAQYSSLGRHEEAFAEFRRALAIDPLSLIINRAYGVTLIHARKYDEAVTQLKKTLELDSNFLLARSSLAHAYRLQGRYAESVEESAKLQELRGNYQDAALRRESFSKGGWQGYLRTVTGEPRPANLTSIGLATFHAELGEKDKAFVELNKAYEIRDPFFTNLKVEPSFDPLQSDPRFAELMRRVGLPQ